MKKLFQIGLLLWLAANATAQESPAQNPPKVLRTYDWKDLNVQSTNCQIQTISMDGMSVLEIEHTNANLSTISLLEITNSTAIHNAGFIVDEIKYKMTNGNSVYQIEGGYQAVANALILLSQFAPAAVGGDKRILASVSGNITGESNWQPFRLTVRSLARSFDMKPEQMKLQLFLSEPGTIYLRPIKLMGTVNSFNWWSPQQAGLIGGIGGSIIGCFGGLIGLLAGKGKARKFVLGAVKFSIALGICLIIAGLVAMALKQPYAVWYALLLPGVILVLVFSLNLHSIQRRYDELEIRRMTSIDTIEN